MVSNFCGLPQELHTEILSYLDAVSLVCCAMTCKAIHASFKNSTLLVYTVQLHLDGLKDAGTSHSHSVLLESLARRRQAWLALEVNEPLTRHTQGGCGSYELAGGAFATTSDDVFEIIWLPTICRPERPALRTPAIEIAAGRLVMDPTQNLVAFLERDEIPASANYDSTIRIHLRTISTNAIHSQAQQSPLLLTLPGHIYEIAMTIAGLKIAYNTLAIYFRNAAREARVVIWDWITIPLDLSILYSLLCDATYCFTACEANSGSLRLYQLPSSRPVGAPATHLATLHLPPTSPGITIHRIRSQAGPVEAHPLPHTPFAVDEERRLHMLIVQYARATEDIRYVNLFVHQRVLLKYVRRAARTGCAPLDIPWAEWGPPHTRVVLSSFDEHISRWKRFIHGQRAVLAQRSSIFTEDPSRAVDVFDFSLATVLSAQGVRGMSSASPNGGHGRLLLSSTIYTTDGPPLFLADVETHLPCVVSTLHLKQSYSTIMIWADGIFGLDVDEDSDFILKIYPV